ncbi:MAG: sugar-binding domain-containing protein, partial [Bacillota bacterium]
MERYFQQKACRQKENFGFDWQFALTDDAAMPPESAAWRDVQLPHDWSAEYPVDENAESCGSGGYARTGIGWYRKRFAAMVKPGERASLYFEGVYMHCDLWLNGAKIGGHVYGYTSFEADITGVARPGGNELLVRVDNSRQPNSRWYTGSGITRGVYLCKTQALCVATWGAYVYTPVVTEEMAEVCLDMRVLGGGAGQNARMETGIFDADGKRVAVRQTVIPQTDDAVL